ncbi:MAG: hypothetical protein CME71_04345 [Halobacteriovorax sp.]|nr:hypothetical protein [Halobacteriovorax sp.]
MKKWSFIVILLSLFVLAFVINSDHEEVAVVSDSGTPQAFEPKKMNQTDEYNRVHSNHNQAQKVSKLTPSERLKPKALGAEYSDKARGPSSIESYFHDEKVSIDGSPYLVSQTLRVLPSHLFDSRDGSVVTKISGYIFFESTNLSLGQPALFNERKKSLSILTGRLLLSNMNLEKAQSIASTIGAELDTSMAHLNVYALSYTSDVLALQNEVGQGSVAEIVHGVVHAK